LPSWASVSREAASGVSVPRLGRWATVAFSVTLLWIFGFAAEARADELADDVGTILTVADTDTTTEDVASTDAGTVTEPVDTSTGTEPTEPTPTTEPTEPTPTTEPTEPTPTTDPAATAPPTEPTPVPEPITPVTEPTPTTETPVSPEPAGSDLKSSIVVLDEPPPSTLFPPSPGTTLAALVGISPAVSDRASELTRAPDNAGNGHSAPAAPELPQLPAPHNPSAPANPAPGGVGGTGSSALGVLAALFALAFAGLLGEVLPVSVAALRPPDLAFHLKRPG
jgi:outer membrane biosynthesis protein TonB